MTDVEKIKKEVAYMDRPYPLPNSAPPFEDVWVKSFYLAFFKVLKIFQQLPVIQGPLLEVLEKDAFTTDLVVNQGLYIYSKLG